MMNNKLALGIVIGLILGITICSNSVTANEEDEKALANVLPQIIEPVDLNRQYTWAGEIMPDNFDTKERLDRELLVNAYWQSSTLLNIKAANRYFPVIERILAEEGVPDDFKYLAVAESNLRNVVSSANAKGFWQFRKLAAKEMGLEVNDQVDERYHVEKATRAACGYLKKLHKRFGSWVNASAAYNMGPGNFSKNLNKQGESSYYDLNLGSETSRYVFRLIAIKEIMSNPQNYGFYVDQHEKYPPLDNFINVHVDKSVDSWNVFAKQHGTSYRMLKLYNPWLRDTDLTVIKNTYLVKIPRK